jgi:hypothetical protein
MLKAEILNPLVIVLFLEQRASKECPQIANA